MIVCSCNVLSDQVLRSAAAGVDGRRRMSQIYACLGCKAQCGRCAATVRQIMNEAERLRRERATVLRPGAPLLAGGTADACGLAHG